MSSLGLFPFMDRGSISITDDTSLNDITLSGLYTIMPAQGAWGSLVVFKAFDGAGGTTQVLYNLSGASYRIRSSNTENLWTDWKTF